MIPELVASLDRTTAYVGELVRDVSEEGMVGHPLLQIVAAHTAYHAGQLAAWRRATGRGPVDVFI